MTDATPEVSEKKSKTKLPAVPDVVQGAVFYTDGGVRPTNPGYGGWGMHGYIYSDQSPKKGSGNTKYHLTVDGYIEKSKNKLPEVKPMNYVNGWGSIHDKVTNNVAEMVASTWALNYAKEFKPLEVTIITDSEAVVNGATHFVAKWEQNGWIKSDGSPVKNQEHWKSLKNAVTDLEATGTKVGFKWIKAHNDHTGNNEADFLATLGVMHARKGNIKSEVDVDQADGYWSKTVDKHPFICNRYMYFLSDPKYIAPNTYYMGNHGKDYDLIGWCSSNTTYSVVILNEPEEIVECIRELHLKIAGNSESFIVADIDAAMSKANEILRYGTTTLYQPNPKKQDLLFLDKTPITKEMRPPRLSMRVIDAMTLLGDVLANHNDAPLKYACTDITDLIFEQEQTKKEIKTKIKSTIQNDTVLEVQANCPTAAGQFATAMRLHLGVDCCDRNTLKKLEKLTPKVTLVVWMESPTLAKCATITECSTGKIVTSAIYSNGKVISLDNAPVHFAVKN